MALRVQQESTVDQTEGVLRMVLEALRSILEVQRQSLTGQRELIAITLEQLRHDRRRPASLSRTDREKLARLLPPIAGATGSELFVAHELLESENAALRVALRGLNAKQLGRLLRRAIGTAIAGLVVERVACEAGAVVWRVSEFLGNENLSVPHATHDESEQ